MTKNMQLLGIMNLLNMFLLGSNLTFLYTDNEHDSLAHVVSYTLLGVSGLCILLMTYMTVKRGAA